MSTDEKVQTVIAEHAPLGVLLWPVTDEKYVGNYTLDKVAVFHPHTPDAYVEWTFRTGVTRTFKVGQEVVVRINPNNRQEHQPA